MLKKFWKNIGNTSHKFLKTDFVGNFVKFSKQFLEKRTKNWTETSNNFNEKLLQRIQKKLENIWGTFENLSRGASNLNPALCSNMKSY